MAYTQTEKGKGSPFASRHEWQTFPGQWFPELLPEAIWEEGDIFFPLSAQDLQRWTFPEHMFSFDENRSDGNLTKTHSSEHLKWTSWWVRKTEAPGPSRGLWQGSCRLSWASWDSGLLILQSWPLWPGSFVEHDGSKQTCGIIPENDRSKYTCSHWGGKTGDPQGCLSWGAHASSFPSFTLLLSFYFLPGTYI